MTDLDPEEIKVRVADVKRRRNPMIEAAAAAELELAAAAIGRGDPEAVEALELAIADNEAFAEKKEQRRGA